MKNKLLAGLFGAILPLAALHADEPKAVAPGTPLNITVTPGVAAPPDVSISLQKRTAHVVPCKSKCTHTGGGNIDVQQPSPDTIVVTMTGAAVAYGTPFNPGNAGMNFDMTQLFEISFDKPTVKAAKITIEGRVIGALRSSCKGGCAEESATASVSGNGGGASVVSVDMPSHSVANGQNLSINDHEGPNGIVINAAGSFVLSQTFHVQASMPKTGLSGKAPSVEFAPDPAIDPLWISAREPFHGIAKKDFGFQITVKVAPEEVKEEPKKNGKEPEKVPAPTKTMNQREPRPFAVNQFELSPYATPRR